MSRVLVVEPDRPLQAELLGAVRGAGYEGAAARDVEAALSALRASRFDAVVLDLPQEDALPTVTRVLRAAEGGAVIATAAAPSPQLTIGVLRLGVRALLRKPLVLASLEATLGSATRGDVPVPPLLATRPPVMQHVLEQAREAARADSTLVLVGESGTGKDLLARYVHAHSPRRGSPLGVVDCALSTEEGEAALRELPAGGDPTPLEGGTLLFHRVLEASEELQEAMVRLLHGRDLAAAPVAPAALGSGERPRGLDLRVIATSTRELDDPGPTSLRRDLRLRLDVLRLRIPPLRERPEDIPLLARELLARLSAASGCEPPVLTDAALERLALHRFRGNVRELENLMRQAVLRFPGRAVDAEILLSGGALPAAPSPAETAAAADEETFDLREIEKRAILRSLVAHGGNRSQAARSLGISTRTLRNKLRRYGLS